MQLRILLEEDEGGWFVASCPDLPGCVSQGKSIEEATANIKEAIEGYLESITEDAIANQQRNGDDGESKKSQGLRVERIVAHYRPQVTV